MKMLINLLRIAGKLLLLAVFLLVPLTVFGSNGDGGPPFWAGQIVIQGSTADLPDDYEVIKYLPHADLTVVRVEPGREFGRIRALQARGKQASLNLKYQKSEAVNDPYYTPYQWHLTHSQSDSAWTVTAGEGVNVAVLDTGLAEGGPDGIGCVAPGINIINSRKLPNDRDGHGTHVSGTIAQRTNNGTGVAGMAYGACIMPVKVLDDNGSGSTADIADGIYYAVENGAQVINMSLGTDARSQVISDPFMDSALEHAYTTGVTVVCAAGNEGYAANVSYPAIYPTTIGVGATDYTNSVTGYSNKGTGLDLVAPGGDLSKDQNSDGYGDGVLQETRINNQWGYWFFEGTSMASPHVAAIAAMLIASQTATTPDEVRTVLTATALDLGEEGPDFVSGHGLVQAYDALQYVPDVPPPPCTDFDGDGYDDISCGGTDCDDSDSSVHPGAEEVCGDGIDQDCDGGDEICPLDDPVCLPKGEVCADNPADCCSGLCHPVKGTCK